MIKPCVVIPVYNHEHAIGAMVAGVLAQQLHCILVDDGSSTACAKVLDQIASTTPDCITLLRHTKNSGKGAAVLTGFKHAAAAGYSHALQIDADGQHSITDIPKFLTLANTNPDAVITGYPQYDKSVPKIRQYARYLTHVWVWINTLSFTIKDSMCGFRIYPLNKFMALAEKTKLGQRMDFDTDVLVRLHWDGVEIINVPTRVNYPSDGISHFRLLLDNLLISRMHAKLFFGMLRRGGKLRGGARHWSRINEITFITGIKFLFLIFRLGGRWPFRIVLYPVVMCYVITQASARNASHDYLQRTKSCYPTINIKPNLFYILRHFAAFAEAMLDKLLLWGNLFKLGDTKYHGEEHILQCIKQQRGGLLICAHLGNLELCRVLSKKRNGMKLNILVHTKHAPTFNKLLTELDSASQLNLIQVTEISPATAILLTEKITQGEFVVITGDRIPVVNNQNPRVSFAQFLGKPAPFPVGPYVLASLLQCPVYLTFALRTTTGAELYIEPFRETIQLPRKNREQIFTELVTAYAARLEYYCSLAPLQWFNFYDFWCLLKR